MPRRARLLLPLGAVPLALVALAGGCDGDPPAADSATAETPAVADGGSDSTGATAGVVRIAHARAEDLTGDGRPERVVVTGEGARADSLEVRLEIRSADGALHFVRRWDSWGYFKYDEPGELSPGERERRVSDQLARLVADSAFAPRHGEDGSGRPVLVDTATIAYDVARNDWRRANGVADTLPMPPAWLEEQGRREVAGAPGVLPRARALASELAGRPTYSFFMGGEESYTVAWSPTERRFVEVWACC